MLIQLGMPERMVGMMNGDDATLFIVAALHIEIDGSGYGGIARILGNLLLLHDVLHNFYARQDLVTCLARHGTEHEED